MACDGCGCQCRVATNECILANSNLPLAIIAVQSDGFWNTFQDLFVSGYKDNDLYPLLLGSDCYSEFCAALVSDDPLPAIWQDLYDSKEFQLYIGTAFEYYWKSTNQDTVWTVEGASKSSENAVSKYQIEAQLKQLKEILTLRRANLMEFIKTLNLPCLLQCPKDICDPCKKDIRKPKIHTTSRNEFIPFR